MSFKNSQLDIYTFIKLRKTVVHKTDVTCNAIIYWAYALCQHTFYQAFFSFHHDNMDV